MVIATIQSIVHGKGDITAYNGKLVEGDEKQNLINYLYEALQGKKLGENEIFKPIGKAKTACIIEHCERDESGRIRNAVVLIENASDDEIRDTLDALGISYHRFCELRSDYRKRAIIKASVVLLAVIVAWFIFIK
ncbi:hypothetical protein [Helicobacter sp. T3_23-1056]